jgi:2,3-bisphosphoglycerate-dependent phosphoglycerate mutase
VQVVRYSGVMSHIALIRHGSFVQPEGVPSAHLPHPLDDRGRRQAREEATKLATLMGERRLSPDLHIDSSMLLRAYETSLIFAEVLGSEFGEMKVDQFDCLAERCLGSAANLTLDEIDAIVDADPRLSPLPRGWKATTDFKLPLPGAESLFEAGRRVADHLLEYAKSAAGKDKTLKLVVGHGGAFRHAAMHLGLLTREDIPRLSMWHCKPVLLRCDAEGRWSHVEGEWKVRPNAPSDDV